MGSIPGFNCTYTFRNYDPPDALCLLPQVLNKVHSQIQVLTLRPCTLPQSTPTAASTTPATPVRYSHTVGHKLITTPIMQQAKVQQVARWVRVMLSS